MVHPPSRRVLAFPAAPEQGGRMLSREDHPLFARAFREHYPDLLAFVRRRVGTETEAADIAQEAYARVLRYRDEQTTADLRPLVFRIAMNLVSSRARAARVERGMGLIPLDDELTVAADAPSQERMLAGEQLLERLMGAIGKLPRKCRQVFMLRRFHGMGRQEVAERLGISAKTVDDHMATALAACRRKAGRDWP